MQTKNFSAREKTKIVLEVLKEQETVAQIASKYEIAPKRIYAWRLEFLEKAEQIFDFSNKKKEPDKEIEIGKLYQQIGELQVENNWLKKKSADAKSRFKT